MSRYRDRQAKGKCPGCGARPPRDGMTLCQICADRAAATRRRTYETRHARWKEKLRQDILDHYGRECACAGCPETDERFLTIDHINGGGNAHRKEIGRLAIWLRQQGYPTGFQMLCWNCNAARAIYGMCPHLS